MSYTEYKDLFEKCQSYAPYHLFIYDVVKGREVVSEERQNNLRKLIFGVYEELQKLEKVKNLEILHKSDDLYYGKLKKDQEGYKIEYPERKLPREDLLEPFLVAGDLMGFTIKRGTLNSKQVDYIFEQKKKELGINYSFHKANGFYETDKWEEGAEKYFRGYCIQQLEENSKIEEKKQEELER